jgi:hypothetical protein
VPDGAATLMSLGAAIGKTVRLYELKTTAGRIHPARVFMRKKLVRQTAITHTFAAPENVGIPYVSDV